MTDSSEAGAIEFTVTATDANSVTTEQTFTMQAVSVTFDTEEISYETGSDPIVVYVNNQMTWNYGSTLSQ